MLIRSGKPGAGVVDKSVLEKERENDFELKRVQRFRYRTRYFTDSGIIGTKEFVSTNYQRFKDIFMSKKDTGLIPDILNEKSMVPRDRIELPTRGFSDLIFEKAEMA